MPFPYSLPFTFGDPSTTVNPGPIPGGVGATWPPPDSVNPMPGIGAIPPSMQPTKITSQQVNAWRIQFIETILQTVVQAITGTFLPGGGSAFNQLISVFGSLFGAAGGATGLGQFTNFFTNLLSIFGVSGNTMIGTPGSFDPTTVLYNWITTLI